MVIYTICPLCRVVIGLFLSPIGFGLAFRAGQYANDNRILLSSLLCLGAAFLVLGGLFLFLSGLLDDLMLLP